MRAEEALASEQHFIYTARQWDSFIAALDRPAQLKRRLRSLLTKPSILERQ